jgi:hypothetical protein
MRDFLFPVPIIHAVIEAHAPDDHESAACREIVSIYDVEVEFEVEFEAVHSGRPRSANQAPLLNSP